MCNKLAMEVENWSAKTCKQKIKLNSQRNRERKEVDVADAEGERERKSERVLFKCACTQTHIIKDKKNEKPLYVAIKF